VYKRQGLLDFDLAGSVLDGLLRLLLRFDELLLGGFDGVLLGEDVGLGLDDGGLGGGGGGDGGVVLLLGDDVLLDEGSVAVDVELGLDCVGLGLVDLGVGGFDLLLGDGDLVG